MTGFEPRSSDSRANFLSIPWLIENTSCLSLHLSLDDD